MLEDLTYFSTDTFELIMHVPYRSLMTFKAGQFYYSDMSRKCLQYQKALYEYPDCLCEPLDSFYNLHRVLSTVNDKIIFDSFHLINVWGGWRTLLLATNLVLFKPDEKFRELVKAEIPRAHPKNLWILELALEMINGKISPRLRKVHRDILYVKNWSERIPQNPFFIRANMLGIQSKHLEKDKEKILEVYKCQGVKAAHKIARETLLGYYAIKTFKEFQTSENYSISAF